MAEGQLFHSWEVPEFERHHHPWWWYAVAGGVLLVGVIYAVITANALFAVIIVLYAIITVYHEIQEPQMGSFGIMDTGIAVHGKFYPYARINHFWLAYEDGGAKAIYFDVAGGWVPHVKVPLDGADAEDVRATLNQFIAEDTSKESDTIFDRVKKVLRV
ncbi:MAG: hypothetical protein HW383_783 [Candidatus Magasanikbacteria bacterium]|nr:hypothetical protein [Candidatus Magasanikbacteria bacterium]